jgi:putative heme transporter
MAGSVRTREREGYFALAARAAWRFVGIALALTLLGFVAVHLRLVFIPVIVALFVTTVLAVPTAWLRKRGWPSLLAVVTVFVGSLVLLAALMALIVPQVADQVGAIGRALRQGSDQVLRFLAQGPLQLSQADIQKIIDQAANSLRSNSSSITTGLLSGAVAVAETVAGTILVLVLTFFFLKDGERMFEWVVSQFRGPWEAHAREIGGRAWASMGGYIRGVAIIAVVDAVLIGLALLLIRVPLVIPLMVLTFFGAFFPLVGATVAGIVAALVALVTKGVFEAVLVVAAIVFIQQLEGHVLQPVVVGRAVRLHPVVILLSLTAGAIVAGIAGAFLAVPLAAVTTSVASYIRAEREAFLGAEEPATEEDRPAITT